MVCDPYTLFPFPSLSLQARISQSSSPSKQESLPQSSSPFAPTNLQSSPSFLSARTSPQSSLSSSLFAPTYPQSSSSSLSAPTIVFSKLALDVVVPLFPSLSKNPTNSLPLPLPCVPWVCRLYHAFVLFDQFPATAIFSEPALGVVVPLFPSLFGNPTSPRRYHFHAFSGRAVFIALLPSLTSPLLLLPSPTIPPAPPSLSFPLSLETQPIPYRYYFHAFPKCAIFTALPSSLTSPPVLSSPPRYHFFRTR